MRVDSSKHKPVEKNERSNFKTEKTVFDSHGASKMLDAAKTPTTGAFAKILEEARHDAARGKNQGHAAKAEAGAEAAGHAAETDEDADAARRAEIKREEKNGRDGASADGGEDDGRGFASNAQASGKPASDAAAPAARAILHVADLERIVAFVRAQTAQNAAQILIALRHSVLDGLQVRLTLDAGGRLKAEFLARSEPIKKQLEHRRGELLDILRQRSQKFAAVEIVSG